MRSPSRYNHADPALQACRKVGRKEVYHGSSEGYQLHGPPCSCRFPADRVRLYLDPAGGSRSLLLVRGGECSHPCTRGRAAVPPIRVGGLLRVVWGQLTPAPCWRAGLNRKVPLPSFFLCHPHSFERIHSHPHRLRSMYVSTLLWYTAGDQESMLTLLMRIDLG